MGAGLKILVSAGQCRPSAFLQEIRIEKTTGQAALSRHHLPRVVHLEILVELRRVELEESALMPAEDETIGIPEARRGYQGRRGAGPSSLRGARGRSR